MTRTPSAWIVLKFGGTSVATLGNWTNIAGVVSERAAGGARVLLVHSAVSGITDRLERFTHQHQTFFFDFDDPSTRTCIRLQRVTPDRPCR